MTIEKEYDQLFSANNRHPEAATISAWDLDQRFFYHQRSIEVNEYFGFTGDPKIDNPRKRRIMRELGPDNFDYIPGLDDGEPPRSWSEDE